MPNKAQKARIRAERAAQAVPMHVVSNGTKARALAVDEVSPLGVVVTPSNASHINILRHAARTFARPCFLRLVRHPLATVAEGASRRLSATLADGAGGLGALDGGSSASRVR